MSKKFLLDLPEMEHQKLKIAAAKSSVSMHQFVRMAISEKIQRLAASESLHTPTADTNETNVLAQASEKPA